MDAPIARAEPHALDEGAVADEILDDGAGREVPDVHRAFVPVGCGDARSVMRENRDPERGHPPPAESRANGERVCIEYGNLSVVQPGDGERGAVGAGSEAATDAIGR